MAGALILAIILIGGMFWTKGKSSVALGVLAAVLLLACVAYVVTGAK